MQILKYRLGFVITEIKQLPEERVLHVVWLGGKDFKEWVDQANTDLHALALKHGCAAIEAHCRLGLARLLRPKGYKAQKITIRAEICPVHSAAAAEQ